jgi:hypothetical protein
MKTLKKDLFWGFVLTLILAASAYPFYLKQHP